MPRPPSPARLLLKSLEEAQTPLYVLDARRQIVFANSALGQWLGIDAATLISRRCDYQADGIDALAAVTAGLCPPSEALAGKADDGFVSRVASGSLPFERRPARFVSINGENADDNLLLVVVAPQAAATEPRDEQSLSSARLHAVLLKLRSQMGKRFHISQLLGESDAIARVREQVRVAAESRARVLVIGRAGSGREHVARTIHFGQTAASVGPLVPVDCALVDAEQMQAALASILRRQHDEPAAGIPAALLLNVDRLRADAQHELLGFFQLPSIHLHTLATARVDLRRLVARGKFRSELAYALSTLTIALPPLSSRRVDIPILAQHFLEEANVAGARQLAGFQPAAMELLSSLPWRGQIDELAQAVREACARAAGTKISVADLPDWVHLAKDDTARPPRDEQPIQLDALLANIERELLNRALKRTRGNKSKAADLLGLTRQRLLRRLAQLGLIPQAEAEEPVVFEPLPDE